MPSVHTCYTWPAAAETRCGVCAYMLQSNLPEQPLIKLRITRWQPKQDPGWCMVAKRVCVYVCMCVHSLSLYCKASHPCVQAETGQTRGETQLSSLNSTTSKYGAHRHKHQVARKRCDSEPQFLEDECMGGWAGGGRMGEWRGGDGQAHSFASCATTAFYLPHASTRHDHTKDDTAASHAY